MSLKYERNHGTYMNKFLISGLFLNNALLVARHLDVSIPDPVYWIGIILAVTLMITGMVKAKK